MCRSSWPTRSSKNFPRPGTDSPASHRPYQAADDFDGLGTGLRSVGDTYDELEKQHIETLDIINKALDGIQPKKA
jgi:hypothetical protein